jgi:hypothetical protein
MPADASIVGQEYYLRIRLVDVVDDRAEATQLHFVGDRALAGLDSPHSPFGRENSRLRQEFHWR